MMRLFLILSTILFVSVSAFAQQRPLLTEDVDITPEGTIEVAAGVDFHGVHDWSQRVAGLVVPTDTADRNRVARESSPISAVDKWRSPVLLIHGDDDRNVEFSQTVNLVRRLRASGVEFEQIIYPDEIHELLLHQDWLRAYHATADFFDKHLK